MAQLSFEDDSGIEVLEIVSEEAAKKLANLYNNFLLNRRKISNRVTRFINRAEKREILEVHCKNHTYQLVHPDVKFFIDGYALLNDIRVLLGLEPTEYMVGILDQTTNSAHQVSLKEKAFLKYARSRGTDKIALSHSLDTVEQLLKNKNIEDISDTLIPFIEVIENKTEQNKDDMNYGYAFEAYGHYTHKQNFNAEGRHDAYYNYYKMTRINTLPWTTGGDVGKLQYKLIRIYEDEKGSIQVSSASISSGNLIIKELQKIKNLLNESDYSPAKISYELAKSFTQIQFDKKMTKSIEKKVDEILKNYINIET